MAILLVETQLTTVASATGTVALPTGIQSGDFIELYIFFDSADRDVSAGLSSYTDFYTGYSTSEASIGNRLFYKVAGDSEPNPTVTVPDGSIRVGFTALAVVWRGVDQTTPIDSDVFTSGAFTTSRTSGSVTTVTAGAMLRAFGAADGTSAITFSEAGYTYAQTFSQNVEGGIRESYHAVVETPGATDGSSWTIGSSDGLDVLTYAIRPGAEVAPTITNINTTNEFTPGEANTLNGTNLSTTGGSIVINDETQTITNRTTSAITFTGVRGGNPYNTDLTLTYTDADSNEVTQTVQQVPAVGFSVTAASPNTTDPASLWSGLVDTATGDPVTVVDGDQALVADPNNLGNLAVTPAGEISADTEGNFVVQFWRASEGVWGSDQTVTFEVPNDNGGGTVTIGSSLRPRRIGNRKAVRSAANASAYQAIYRS